MFGREPHRGAGIGFERAALAAATVAAVVVVAPARAEGLWDGLLEKMNVKAAPPAPGPDFVERTRPDPADLGYLPTATPHKVSPLPVKGAAQIQAQKDALDLAKARQLDPRAGKPAEIVKAAAAPAATPRPARRAHVAPKAAAVTD